MAFIRGYEFVVENKSGMVFNFYLNTQKHIEYIISDEKRRWKERELVFNQATEKFHLDIDDNDNIHIISYSKNGCLYYHQYLDEAWINHLILHYPTGQRIIYPIIKHINSQIHIFYYLLHDESRDKAHLLHLKFYDKEYSTNHIITVNNHEYINPFKVFVNNDEIILLYTSIVEGHEQILVSKFNMSTEICSDPLCITSSKDKKIYLDALRYNDKMLHLIWSKFDEEYLAVQYLKLNIDTMTTDKSKPVSLSAKSSCSFPIPVYYKNILWAIWTEMEKIVSCYSIDMGKNWSEPYIHEDTKKIDFKRYRYLASHTDNKEGILCDFVFGTPYPNIQFLGFGGENDDEIPTK